MTSWFCHQLGSREYFSIPRALHHKGALGLLQTDIWMPPESHWIARLGRIPNLRERYHPELADARVATYTAGRMAFDLKAKLRGEGNWAKTAARDIWFQEQCLPTLRQHLATAPNAITFSYAYTAQKLFQEAKKFESPCILGQIDPGPAEHDWLRETLPENVSQAVEDRPKHYWDAWREEIEMADCIVVNSSWSQKLLAERANVPEAKMHVLPLAYAPPEVAEKPRNYPEKFTQQRPLRVLFLGQVIPRKGVHLLLKAMRTLSDQPVQLDLVGPVSMELGNVPPNVNVMGAVDTTTALECYRKADVFILPTFSDGFALTQLEAAAQRLPLIVSRHLGDVVKARENGLILEELSSAAIEAAITECIDNPAELERWSTYDLDWNEYSLERLGERLIAIAANEPV